MRCQSFCSLYKIFSLRFPILDIIIIQSSDFGFKMPFDGAQYKGFREQSFNVFVAEAKPTSSQPWFLQGCCGLYRDGCCWYQPFNPAVAVQSGSHNMCCPRPFRCLHRLLKGSFRLLRLAYDLLWGSPMQSPSRIQLLSGSSTSQLANAISRIRIAQCEFCCALNAI